VRTPLFSFSFLLNELKLGEIDFKKLIKNPIFREALFLASPDFYQQIEKWEKGKLKDPQKIERLQFSILKYATRISSRCTPLGLFASCGFGEFGLETNFKTKKKSSYKRITRFDTTFLTQLLQELLKNKTILEHVLFYPNTSIYKIGNHYRYVEYTLEKKKRNYSLEGFSNSVFIETILKSAKKGKTVNELSNLLIDDDITIDEAKVFIEELIDNQILVSELEISVTGVDNFQYLINRIGKISEAKEIYTQLLALQKQLNELDRSIGNSTAICQSLIENAKNIVPQLEEKYLFQTDTFSTFKNNTLNQIHKKQLKKAFVFFNKMTLPSANGNIVKFKKDFLRRYEQAEVPLNLALDTETGIGFGPKKQDANELIDDLFLSSEKKKRYEHIIWTDVDTVLQQKLIKATENKSFVIQLSDKDFKDIPLNFDDLPGTFSSLIEVYKTDNLEKIFINGVSGASATYLLGRFSHGDKQLLTTVNKIVEIEEKINADKILAEIIHLPEARTGNILQRPTFRNYEIPYLGKSNVAPKYQIPIEDIMISIRNDTIVLRSKKLDTEILPRLGNAHNYSRDSLPIYHFLCAIQTQNKHSHIGFNWNSILKNQSFLPRVECENLIFSKARWKIKVADFEKLVESENLLNTIATWQKQFLIPNFVEFVEGDNKLFINLKNEFSIKMLLDSIKNRKQFIIEEFLFSEDEIIKNQENHSFCNQFVISFYNVAKLKPVLNEK